jgi:DNA-binding HxlR family transcriptional regulator
MLSLLNGATTYTQIAEDSPGIPRSLLTSRLRGLERVGLVETSPNPGGRGSLYHPTDAGKGLTDVLMAMGDWAERWLELQPHHIDPGMILHSWCRHNLAYDRLPEERVVTRFDFTDQPLKINQLWFIFDGSKSEICRTDPGFEEDVVVTATGMALAEWHLGRIEWEDAVRDERIRVTGPNHLARALPRWNRRKFAGKAKPHTAPGRTG